MSPILKNLLYDISFTLPYMNVRYIQHYLSADPLKYEDFRKSYPSELLQDLLSNLTKRNLVLF